MIDHDETKASIIFAVAFYAIDHGLDITETDNAVNAAINIYEKGISPSMSVKAGKVAVAAMTTNKIIHNLEVKINEH